MAGGLLNLVSYGAENIILNGNPNKNVFLKRYIKNILILVYNDFDYTTKDNGPSLLIQQLM